MRDPTDAEDPTDDEGETDGGPEVEPGSAATATETEAGEGSEGSADGLGTAVTTEDPDEPDGSDESDGSTEDPEAPERAEATRPKDRKRRAPVFAPPPAERLEGAVEALLLAAGESLSDERIRDLLGLPSAVHVRECLDAVRARWAEARLPVEIQDVAGGHRVVTRPEFAEYVGRLQRRANADRLSRTLLETLSIVAYRQPVARAEIERVRGVQSGDALRGLLDRRLAKVSGRSDQPGRPLLYATTSRFLEVFGLGSLADLPSAKDLVRL